jgi:hypothetical protein
LVAKEGENITRIVQIGNRQVPFRYTSIKLYYEDVNPRNNDLKDEVLLNATLNNNKLKRNLLRKRGRPKKLNQFINNYKAFL